MLASCNITNAHTRNSQQHKWTILRQQEEERTRRKEALNKQKIQEFNNIRDEKMREKLIEIETLRRFRAIKENEEAQVQAKREELRQILQDDENVLLKSVPTPEDKRVARLAEMKRIASKLEAERILANEKLAQEKYAQRFRESCDLFRAGLSRRKALEIADDLRYQIQEKEKLSKQDRDAMLLDMMFNPFAKEEDPQKVKQRRDDCRLNAEFLANQISEKILEEEQKRLEKMREKEKMDEFLLSLQNEIEQKSKELCQRKQALREELDRHVEKRREHERKELEIEQEMDRLLLEQARQAQEEEHAHEEETRARRAKEMKQYLEYLRSENAKKAENERETDRLVDQWIEEQNNKRQSEQRTIRARKLKQALEVSEACKAQITDKEKRRVCEQEEHRKYGERLKEILEREQKDYAELLAKKHQECRRYREQLERQIAERGWQKAQMEEEQLREQRQQQQCENELIERIEDLIRAETAAEANRHPWRAMLASQPA